MKKGFAVLIIMILGFSFLQPVSAAEMVAEQLKKEVVTSGDGLYADPTVPGRYVFKGANPNNYITIGDDVYRIISVESDGSLKVMSTVSLERDFDSLWSRSSSDSNDYCYNTGESGCNVWGSKTTVFDTDGKLLSGTVQRHTIYPIEQEMFQRATKGEEIVDYFPQHQLLAYMMPMEENRTVTGVLVGFRSMEDIQRLLKDKSFSGKDSSAIIDE